MGDGVPSDERISRRLAFLLRHRPDAGGITLSADGWASLDDVAHALGVDRSALEALVDAPGKRRFELDDVTRRVRAVHGHSVDVEIDHAPVPPPDRLFHGTVASRVASIQRSGLLPGKRIHVHLSSTEAEAREVGSRRGKPVVIEVRAAALARERGARFLLVPDSTIWLVASVPPEYLAIPMLG